MSTIAVPITNMFENSEYAAPAQAFTKAGHELVHLGFRKGKTVRGRKNESEVKIDKAVKDVSASESMLSLFRGPTRLTS